MTEMRKAIIASDAWRSFFIIAVGCFLLFLFLQKRLKASFTLVGIVLLCLVDMWCVVFTNASVRFDFGTNCSSYK